MKKILLGVSLGTVLVVGGAGSYVYIQQANTAEKITFKLASTVNQLKELGLNAKYTLSTGFLKYSGVYTIGTSDKDYVDIKFTTDRNMVDIITKKPVKIIASVGFNAQFKEDINKSPKQIEFFKSINNGSFLDSDILSVEGILNNDSLSATLNINPIQIKEDKYAYNTLSISGARAFFDYDMLSNKMLLDSNIGLVEATKKGSKVMVAQNIKFKKEFLPGNIYLGASEFSLDSYKFGLMGGGLDNEISGLSAIYDFAKKDNQTYSIKNNFKINKISIPTIEPNASLEFETNLIGLKSASIDGLLGLFDQAQEVAKDSLRAEKEKDPNVRSELVNKVFNKTLKMQEEGKGHLLDLLTNGFIFSMDKVKITGTKAGNFVMAFRMTLNPSAKREDISTVNGLSLQLGASLKGGDAVKMLPMLSPDVASGMKSPEELGLTAVYNKKNVYINNESKEELAETFVGILTKVDASIQEVVESLKPGIKEEHYQDNQSTIGGLNK